MLPVQLGNLLLALVLSQFITLQSHGQGAVGIGTATPNSNAKLDIFSDSAGLLIPRLTSAQETTLGGQLAASDEALLLYNTSISSFRFWDGSEWVNLNNTDAQTLSVAGSTLTISNGNSVNMTDDDWVISGNIMYNTNPGKVGIGTQTPLEKLHIKGAICFQRNSLKADFIANADDPRIYSSDNFGSVYPFANDDLGHLIFQPRSSLPRDLIFATGSPTPAAALVIKSDRNIGIGTATPGQKLEVAGNIKISSNRGVLLFTGDNNTTHVGGLQVLTNDNGANTYMNPTNASGTPISSVLHIGSDGNFHSESTKLNVHGELNIDSQKPIIMRRYAMLGDNATYDTGFSTSTYAAAIVGHDSGDFDYLETCCNKSILKMSDEGTSTWHIRAELPSDAQHENWSVDVLFISRKMADSNY